jgi:hypothetical protein
MQREVLPGGNPIACVHPSQALPKVDTNCTAPSLTMVTRFAASLPTDSCPQPKEAQPLSQLDNPINTTF